MKKYISKLWAKIVPSVHTSQAVFQGDHNSASPNEPAQFPATAAPSLEPKPTATLSSSIAPSAITTSCTQKSNNNAELNATKSKSENSASNIHSKSLRVRVIKATGGVLQLRESLSYGEIKVCTDFEVLDFPRSLNLTTQTQAEQKANNTRLLKQSFMQQTVSIDPKENAKNKIKNKMKTKLTIFDEHGRRAIATCKIRVMLNPIQVLLNEVITNPNNEGICLNYKKEVKVKTRPIDDFLKQLDDVIMGDKICAIMPLMGYVTLDKKTAKLVSTSVPNLLKAKHMGQSIGIELCQQAEELAKSLDKEDEALSLFIETSGANLQVDQVEDMVTVLLQQQ